MWVMGALICDEVGMIAGQKEKKRVKTSWYWIEMNFSSPHGLWYWMLFFYLFNYLIGLYTHEWQNNNIIFIISLSHRGCTRWINCFRPKWYYLNFCLDVLKSSVTFKRQVESKHGSVFLTLFSLLLIATEYLSISELMHALRSSVKQHER